MRWSLIALLVCALPGVAAATSLQRLEPSELAWLADLVVEAEVLTAQVERVEGSALLRTAWELRVDRALKGSAAPGDVVDLVLLGGALGSERTTFEGAPTFTPGERVLVFLEHREDGYHLIGLGQGKLTLVEERSTGRDVLVHLRLPADVPRFDEAAVVLPARPDYADEFLGRLEDELAAGYVPPYRPVAGLAPARDAAFRAAALRQGQRLDARYFDARWHPPAASDPPELKALAAARAEVRP